MKQMEKEQAKTKKPLVLKKFEKDVEEFKLLCQTYNSLLGFSELKTKTTGLWGELELATNALVDNIISNLENKKLDRMDITLRGTGKEVRKICKDYSRAIFYNYEGKIDEDILEAKLMDASILDECINEDAEFDFMSDIRELSSNINQTYMKVLTSDMPIERRAHAFIRLLSIMPDNYTELLRYLFFKGEERNDKFLISKMGQLANYCENDELTKKLIFEVARPEGIKFLQQNKIIDFSTIHCLGYTGPIAYLSCRFRSKYTNITDAMLALYNSPTYQLKTPDYQKEIDVCHMFLYAFGYEYNEYVSNMVKILEEADFIIKGEIEDYLLKGLKLTIKYEEYYDRFIEYYMEEVPEAILRRCKNKEEYRNAISTIKKMEKVVQETKQEVDYIKNTTFLDDKRCEFTNILYQMKEIAINEPAKTLVKDIDFKKKA